MNIWLTPLSIIKYKYELVNPSRISSIIFGIILGVAAEATGKVFVTPALASDLTIEDLISREDPVQDKVTICHIPSTNRSNAHDMTVGESVVPDHLAHGDRIGNCFPTREPEITVEPPTTCINTENGSIAHARVILTGFSIGSVIMIGAQSSEHRFSMEVHDDRHAAPIGFSTGEKTVTVFSDANRNLVKDPDEVSVTKTFTVPCYPNL